MAQNQCDTKLLEYTFKNVLIKLLISFSWYVNVCHSVYNVS